MQRCIGTRLLILLGIVVQQNWADDPPGWTNAGSPDILAPQEGATITVFGTRFTMWNYYSLQGAYIMACGLSDTFCNMWYSSLTKRDNPYVAYGPGPNTTMYYGWPDNKANLESWAPMIQNGTMKRYNELGLQIINSVMWPEVSTIALGYTNEWHAFVRPYLGTLGDNGRQDSVACDGTSCWNLAYFKSVFREMFADMESFTSGDQGWMVGTILAKVFANVTFTKEEAQDLVSFQMPSLAPGPMPPNVADAMEMNSLRARRVKYVDRVKQSLKVKYASQSLNETQITVLSAAILDTMLFAGGLSVPTALDYMLALYYTRLPGWIPWVVFKGEVNLEDTRGLYNWMFEVMRRYPPVAGVPRWITTDGGATWSHEIPNVAKALNDERLFPDPSKIILGRHGLNYDDNHLSIGWADFALEDGNTASPNSHVCPGKDMSKLLIQAFFEEYLYAGPWSPALPFLIYYNAYKVFPPFTLCKHESFGKCTMQRVMFALFLVFLCCCGPCCCLVCCLGCAKFFHRHAKGKMDDTDENDDEDQTLLSDE